MNAGRHHFQVDAWTLRARAAAAAAAGGGEAFAVRGDREILLNTHKRQCGVSYQGSSRIQMPGLYGPLTVIPFFVAALLTCGKSKVAPAEVIFIYLFVCLFVSSPVLNI